MDSANLIAVQRQKNSTKESNKVNKKAVNKVKALVIDVNKSTGAPNGILSNNNSPGSSNSLPEEPFHQLGEMGRIILPPFDMLTLSMLIEHNTELNQCIEAMETNIDATGHRFVSRLKLDENMFNNDVNGNKKPLTQKQRQLLEQSKHEKTKLINFFTYATQESFVCFRRKIRKDLETTGNAYFEVIRNDSGQIQGFTHLPSYQMRLGKLEDKQIETERKILELQIDGSVKVKKQKIIKRFRTYVQSRIVNSGSRHTTLGHKVVWYKEFGDNRSYSRYTGQIEKNIAKNKQANELIHLKLYSTRSPYGLPRYIGNLLSILGDRAAEEINWITFKNNNVPSMMLAVSNGQLTEATVRRIESFVESQIQGSDNYSKFLIVEAEPTSEEGEDGGHVKIDIKPLTESQHNDALFQNYSENNQDKIRRAFRLPPVFVGRAKEYNRAVAESSRRLADEQVFKPERDEFDEYMNRYIFPEMEVVYHKYKSNTPNTTDNAQLVKILGGAEKTGGITPRIARVIMEDILGIDLPDFPDEFPADVPFSMTMAEAVKNQAQPNEPGQQVTALKTLKSLGIIDSEENIDLSDLEIDNIDIDDPESVIDVAKKLLSLNRAAEILWRQRQAEESDE